MPDLGTGDSGAVMPPPPSTGGKQPLSKNAKIGLGVGGFLLLTVGAYIYAKHKSSSSTSSATTTPTTLAVPSSGGVDTGSNTGGYTNGNGGGSANWAAEQTANDQQIAADLAPLLGTSTQGTGSTSSGLPVGAYSVSSSPNNPNNATAQPGYSIVGGDSNLGTYAIPDQDLNQGQVQQLTALGNPAYTGSVYNNLYPSYNPG